MYFVHEICSHFHERLKFDALEYMKTEHGVLMHALDDWTSSLDEGLLLILTMATLVEDGSK